MSFFKKFYYYCIIQYFLFWPIRFLVYTTPFFVCFFVSLFAGTVLVLAEDQPSQQVFVALTDGQQEQLAAEVAIRDRLRNSEFLNRDFTFTNLEDRGDNVKVNYTEELRPYMFKKHMVDARDYQIFRDLDNPKPRKPLKDYITPKNVVIGVVVFVGSMIFLGWLDEQMEGAIIEDLRLMQRRNEEHIAREWAIRVEEWSARWVKVKGWFGAASSQGGSTQQ